MTTQDALYQQPSRTGPASGFLSSSNWLIPLGSLAFVATLALSGPVAAEETGSQGAASATDSTATETASERAERQPTEREASELPSRVTELESALREAENAMSSLEENNRMLSDELDASRRGSADLVKELETAQATLGAKDKDYQILANERSELKSKLDEAVRKNADLEAEAAKLRSAQTETSEAAAAARAKLEAARDELGTALGVAKAKITELEDRLEKQGAEHAKSAAAERELASENQELASELETLRKDMEDLTKRHGDLEKAHVAATTLSKNLELRGEELATELKSEQAAAADLRKALEEAKGQLGKLRENAKTASEAAAAEKESLLGEKQALADELAQTRKASEEEQQSLQLQIATLRDEANAASAAAASEKERLLGETQSLTDELAKIRAASAAEQQSLHRRIADMDKEIQGLKDDVSRFESSLQQTESELNAVRGQLPTAAGGLLTAEDVRERASKQAADLTKLYKKKRKMKRSAWDKARVEIEKTLRDEQFMLADIVSARSVYEVQPEDTLARISWKVYGVGTRWPEIFEANKHVLDNPDRLLQGTSLIIP